MSVEVDGWEAMGTKKRVLVLLQPYDLYLVKRARRAGSEGEQAPSPFVEAALRTFLEMGTNGGEGKALDAMSKAADRRKHGEQLSRRSIRLHTDVNAELDAFAQHANESASVVVEAALDNVLNGEIDDMRADLAEAQRIELGDPVSAD
ncbi:MAG TPA: hypothetical protein VFW48_05515 [Solirubrobacterales bacterium]|nr:hypothetical protein [Solirubrobacterales bacterium]